MTSVDGRIYKGEFSNDKKDGKGVNIEPDGKSYDAIYRKGAKKSSKQIFVQSPGLDSTGG